MPYFNIVAETNQNTVVTEYEPVKSRSDSYESEAALEKEFIRLLGEQGYTYLPIHTEADLIANLRERLEELNKYKFTDTEWDRFFSGCIANPNDHIVEKTAKIQEDFVQVLKRDDNMTKNITLIDRKNIHNNRLQVINQYENGKAEGATYDNRYDVTILVNGLPLVHVELKRRGVEVPKGQLLALKRAVDDWQRAQKFATLIIAEHDVDNPNTDIDAASCHVREFYFKGNKKTGDYTVKALIDHFISFVDSGRCWT